MRVPGIRVWGRRDLHRRRCSRMPRALHPGLGLPAAGRRLRQFHLRRRTLHQFDPVPVRGGDRPFGQKSLPRPVATWEEWTSNPEGTMRNSLAVAATIVALATAVPGWAVGPTA